MQPMLSRLATNSVGMVANNAVLSVTGLAFWFAAGQSTTAAVLGLAGAILGTSQLVTFVAKYGHDYALFAAARAGLPLGKPALRVVTISGATALALALPLVGYFVFTADLQPTNAALLAALPPLAVLSVINDALLFASGRSWQAAVKNGGAGLARLGIIGLAPSHDLSTILSATVAGYVVSIAFGWTRSAPTQVQAKNAPAVRATRSVNLQFSSSLLLIAPITLAPAIALAVGDPRQAGMAYVIWMIGSVGSWLPTSIANQHQISSRRDDRAWLVWAFMGAFALAAPAFLKLLRPDMGFLEVVLSITPFVVGVPVGITVHRALAQAVMDGRLLPILVLAGSPAIVALVATSLQGTAVWLAPTVWLVARLAGQAMLRLGGSADAKLPAPGAQTLLDESPPGGP